MRGINLWDVLTVDEKKREEISPLIMCERTFLPIFFLKDGIKDDGDETKFINLKVMSQDKTEVHFKIKRTTPMLKVSQYPATLLGGVQNP